MTYDGPIDQIPVFSKAQGNDRLDIEDIDNRLLGPVVESHVVFERHIDQGGNRRLGEFGQ